MGRGWINSIKETNSARKGKMISKIAREIQVAAKLGGPDPDNNSRLRLAMDAARKIQCPNDTIDRAIKKGAGLLDGANQIEEITYEGYGPHGVGVIVECLTDNKHRTAPEIRLAFKSHAGAMGEMGSVAWMFDRVALVTAEKQGVLDPVEEAIEVGANEVETSNDVPGQFEFLGEPKDLDAIRQALTKRSWKIIAAQMAFISKNKTELTVDQQKEVIEFLTELNDHDDTSNVYATWEPQ
jgi:YebC/PmpR family DNA-binding regulatory protein